MQVSVFGSVSPSPYVFHVSDLTVTSQTPPVKHDDPKERKNQRLALRIYVKFPKHPDALQLEKLQTHLPLFAHFFDADFKVKDFEATSVFFPIKAKV